MGLEEILAYLGAICMGLILGLAGGGGSIITVPILVYLLHLEAVTATAYSLFVVGITASVGTIRHYQQGNVDFKSGLTFAIPAILAVYSARAFLVPALPDVIFQTDTVVFTKNSALMLLLAAVMFWAAYSMLKKKNASLENSRSYPALVITGLIVGLVTGIIGAGGGFLVVPSLVLFAGLPIKKAIGTTLLVVASKSLIGFIGDLQHLTVDWKLLISFSICAVIGIFIGVKLSSHVNEVKLKKGFAYFVLAMAVFVLFKEIF